MKLARLAAGAALLLIAGTAGAEERFLENETISSIVGDFTFEKGFPTPETTERLFQLRTTYRVMEVIQQNTFAASLCAMRKGFEEFGAGAPNQVIVFKHLMDAKSEFLTANNTTVYAMTVHKSQGSEFDEVLFILPDSDFSILTRELIYTALTRARKKIAIWGTRAIIRKAISRQIERTSGLRDALWESKNG